MPASLPFEPERLQVRRTRGETGIVVLALTGELDSGTTLKLAEATAHVLAAEPPPEALVLDLTGLSFVSIAGARFVYYTHESAGDTRLRVVTGDGDAARSFLHATGFDAVLDCYRTRLEAIVAGSRAEFVGRVMACWNAR